MSSHALQPFQFPIDFQADMTDRERSGFGVQESEMEAYRQLEDGAVYQKLCRWYMPESDRRPQSSVKEDSKT